MKHRFHMLVDGRMTDGSHRFEVINPATGATLSDCPRADPEQLEEAVAAARRAFTGWSAAPIPERAARLSAIADAFEGRITEFARLLTCEQGKPLGEALHEVGATIGIFRATAAMDLPLEILRDTSDERIIRQRTPLGAVAAIMPWNFPLMLMAMKIAPALFAGNTVVAKPAPTTPLTTLLFGELCAPLLPAGVLNIIVDQNDLGGLLTGHPDIARISFTGSTATGRKVMASAAANLARITLELGGNDAAIVLADADVRQVAPMIFGAAMINAGQVCLGTKRVYVHSSLHDALCEALAGLASQAVVGDGLDEATQIGPVQNAAQFAAARQYLVEAHRDGSVIAGGSVLDRPGFFVKPTIVTGLPDDSRLVADEQFSPILPILRYDDVDELVARANAGPYGLGGTIWTSAPEQAADIALRIDGGVLWVNKVLDLPADIALCGAKSSGFGMALGQEGLHEFTQAKVINMAISRPRP